MSAATPKRIEALVRKANSVKSPFLRESHLDAALASARDARHWEAIPDLIDAIMPLRHERRENAIETGNIFDMEESFDDETFNVEPGCYLLHPPHVVAADGRRLRHLSMDQDVATLIVCREPDTDLGLCPIVALAPGATIRTKVKPPTDGPADLDWIIEAADAIGHAAATQFDPALAPAKLAQLLTARLFAVPDSMTLHLAVKNAAIAAVDEAREETPARRIARAS